MTTSEENIRIAIVVDPLGWSRGEPEDEIEQNFNEIRHIIGERAKLVYSKQYADEDIPDKLDILIIDFGGMSAGAGDMARFNVKWFVEYAQNHPSCLLIIWTQFTRYIYDNEVKQDFGDMNNVYLRSKEWNEEGDEWEDLKTKVRTWCGIPMEQEEYWPEVEVIGNLKSPFDKAIEEDHD